jgi:pimeloyl-ACP methyl ester carboxylesterase
VDINSDPHSILKVLILIRFTTRSGLSLAASVAGPEDAPVVLFLHGGGQTRHSWGTAVSTLGEAGFRAITLDTRGHGDSDWATDGCYKLQTLAEDLEDVLAQIRAPSPALVGASLGGLTSLLVTGCAQAIKPAALVLVDVVPHLETEGTAEITGFMAANPDGFASVDEAADVIAAYLPHRAPRKNNQGLMKNLRLRDDGRYYWHWDPAMLGKWGAQLDGTLEKLEDAARAIQVPTLLIKGGKSRIVSAEGVRSFQKLIPHAEFVDIAEADHMVAGDANDAFNAPLLDFLVRSCS